jgi:hypothetical protein
VALHLLKKTTIIPPFSSVPSFRASICHVATQDNPQYLRDSFFQPSRSYRSTPHGIDTTVIQGRKGNTFVQPTMKGARTRGRLRGTVATTTTTTTTTTTRRGPKPTKVTKPAQPPRKINRIRSTTKAADDEKVGGVVTDDVADTTSETATSRDELRSSVTEDAMQELEDRINNVQDTWETESLLGDLLDELTDAKGVSEGMVYCYFRAFRAGAWLDFPAFACIWPSRRSDFMRVCGCILDRWTCRFGHARELPTARSHRPLPCRCSRHRPRKLYLPSTPPPNLYSVLKFSPTRPRGMA